MVNLFFTALLPKGSFEKFRQPQGCILNVISIVGTQVHPFAGAAYACSKAALSTLTRELVAEFGSHGIRVNSIAPGEIATSILSPSTHALVENEVPDHCLASIIAL